MTTLRTLGSSEITVTSVGIGCNAFGTRIDAQQTAAVVDAALEHGVNFFDTADTYGRGSSEELLGAALGEPARPGRHRDEVRHGHGWRQR